VQRLLGEHEQGARHLPVVAVDQSDEPEHQDHPEMEWAERDAVELAAEHVAGGNCPPAQAGGFCHGVLSDRLVLRTDVG
jgi:hypothetical protein